MKMVTGLSNIHDLSTEIITLVYVIQIRHEEVFFQVEKKMRTESIIYGNQLGRKTEEKKRGYE